MKQMQETKDTEGEKTKETRNRERRKERKRETDIGGNRHRGER